MRNSPENILRNSEKVKNNQIQPWPFRGNFQEKDISKKGERNAISQESKTNLNMMIVEATNLFENCQINWAIDGGLSISILNNKFIGEHRDMDLAIEASQLEEIGKSIENKGYGFFVTLKNSNGEKIMKKVDWKEFLTTKTFIHWIIAINEDGFIQKNRPLSFINVHLIRRNKNGDPIDEGDIPLPKEWFNPRAVNYNGKEVKIANPAKTAYYKIMSLRNYDLFDLEYLAKMKAININDLDIIDDLFKNKTSEKDRRLYSQRKKIIEKMKKILE